jgi:alkylation response protein AidB-like acyl-CoA dehydrogenase
VRANFDEAAFRQLADEIEAFVRGPGEDYAAEIERTSAVPPALWADLRERGYLSLAAPQVSGDIRVVAMSCVGLPRRAQELAVARDILGTDR